MEHTQMESEKEKWYHYVGLISDPTQKLTEDSKMKEKNKDGEGSPLISFILKACQLKPCLENDVRNVLAKKRKEKESDLCMCNKHRSKEEEYCEQTYTKKPFRSNIIECKNSNGFRDHKFQQIAWIDLKEEAEEKYERDKDEKEKSQVDDNVENFLYEKHEKDVAEKEKSQVDEYVENFLYEKHEKDVAEKEKSRVDDNDESFLYEEKHEKDMAENEKCLFFDVKSYHEIVHHEQGISELNMLSASTAEHNVYLCSMLNIIASVYCSVLNNEHMDQLVETKCNNDQLELKELNIKESLSSTIKYENNICYKPSMPGKCLNKSIVEVFTDNSLANAKEKLKSDSDRKLLNIVKSRKKSNLKTKKKSSFKRAQGNQKGILKKRTIRRHHKHDREKGKRKKSNDMFRAQWNQQKYWLFKKFDKISKCPQHPCEKGRLPQHFGYLFGDWSNNNRNNNNPLSCGQHKVRTHSGLDHSGGGGTGRGQANGGGTSGSSQSNSSSSGTQANGGSSNGQTGGKGGPGDDKKPNDKEKGNNSSPSLPIPKLDDKHIAMREQVERQRGTPLNVTISTNIVQPGNPAMQPGNPAIQPGNPAIQPGNPSIQTMTDNVQSETIEAMMQVEEDFNDTISVQHATLSIIQLCDLLGTATNTIPKTPEVVMNLNLCLSHALHDLSFSSLLANKNPMSISECTTCNILSQILKHLASLSHTQMSQACDQCSQIYNLILWHSSLCINVGRRRSRSSRFDLCYKICKSVEWNTEMLQTNQKKLLSKVKKYCAKVLSSSSESFDSEAPTSQQGISETDSRYSETPTNQQGISETDSRYSETEALNTVSSNSSLSLRGNIVTTASPELQEAVRHEVSLHSASYTNTVSPHSSLGSSVSSMPGFGSSTSSIPGFGSNSAPGFGSNLVPGFGSNSVPGFGSLTNMMYPASASHVEAITHMKLCRKSSSQRSSSSISIPQPIAEESGFDEKDPEVPYNGGTKDDIDKFIVGRYSEDPYDTQRTYGEQNRHNSMPLGNVHDPEQFMSLWKYPMGEPGVGTVVFGHPSQLRIVATYWVQKRVECETTGCCPYQHREEGVILAEQKDKFNILRTRYQKNVQWQRLTHLGNGMSGKCHLAMDMKTHFKFCCKKIHLLRYSEEELSLWTEMQHPFIVKLYGAIRHGVKIYIFSEFIDGGDLAACIEEQKRLGRRLSHWSAINYFKQLLQVLAYLQTKNILHEDIKADNILLRQNTKYIAVTDFGTSRKLQDPKELKNKCPVGSPTHWSPEKASMEGHGFPSDLWAAVCVLVHMLSGLPPWLKRYQSAGILNYIIYAQPPPMDDVPQNIQEVVRKLIEKGWVKDPQHRPSPSVLLQDPAFSILDNETPETFYSTLMSPHPVRPGIRQAEVIDDNQEHKSMLKTTILNVSPNKTVLYQQHITTVAPPDTQVRHELATNGTSDNLAHQQEDHSANEIVQEIQNDTVTTKQSEELASLIKAAMTVNRDTSQKCQDMHPNNGQHLAGDMPPNIGLTLAGDMPPNIGLNLAGDMPPKVGQHDAGDMPPNIGQHDAAFLISSENSGLKDQLVTAPVTERPRLAPRVYELVEPGSIDKLLPDFAELFPDDDSENMKSIKSFFVDSYMDGDLKLAEKTPLQVYTPVSPELSPEANHLPVLSIFEAGIEASGPASKEDLNTTPTIAATTSATTSVTTPTATVHYSLTNSILTLSSGSECASSELFDTIPSVPADESDKFSEAQNVEDENDLVGACAIMTTTYTTNLMQRKPVNLKLDLNCPPMARSNSPMEHSLTSGESKKSSGGIQTASTSMSSSQQPSPSSGQSTGAIQRPSTHSGSTSSLLQSFSHTSIMEEQKRILKEYSVPNDSTLPGMTDDDVDETEYNANINEDETNRYTATTEDVLSILRNAIGDTVLDGLKLEFYNNSNEKLFEIRVAETPIYLNYILEIARSKIRQYHYTHFTLCYLNGALLDLFRPISSWKLRVVQLTGDPADKCLCGRCPASF